MKFDRNALDKVQPFKTTFDLIDWSKEPKETFKELCRQRAQQIRDTNDYVILYFSGGSDSTTVLNAFVDNGIFIDEVVTSYFEGVEAPCVSGMKAIQDIKKCSYVGLYNRIPIKFQDVENFFKSDNFMSVAPNFVGNIHNIMRFSVDYLERFGFTQSIKRSGKVAHLYGTADPIVQRISNKFYATFNTIQYFMCDNFTEYEFFFTTSDFPQLHVKQCYIVAEDMKRRGSYDINKRVVRDFYDPIISPPKLGGDVSNTLKFRGQYNECSVILDQYIKSEGFIDLYIQSSVKEQIKITSKIRSITGLNRSYAMY
jgi:hypothetical protein